MFTILVYRGSMLTFAKKHKIQSTETVTVTEKSLALQVFGQNPVLYK